MQQYEIKNNFDVTNLNEEQENNEIYDNIDQIEEADPHINMSIYGCSRSLIIEDS